LQIIGLNDQVT